MWRSERTVVRDAGHAVAVRTGNTGPDLETKAAVAPGVALLVLECDLVPRGVAAAPRHADAGGLHHADTHHHAGVLPPHAGEALAGEAALRPATGDLIVAAGDVVFLEVLTPPAIQCLPLPKAGADRPVAVM